MTDNIFTGELEKEDVNVVSQSVLNGLKNALHTTVANINLRDESSGKDTKMNGPVTITEDLKPQKDLTATEVEELWKEWWNQWNEAECRLLEPLIQNELIWLNMKGYIDYGEF